MECLRVGRTLSGVPTIHDNPPSSSRLHPGDISKAKQTYNLPGYSCIRRDRTEPKGGLAIFIRDGIKHTVHEPPADIECQAVSINTSAGQINVVNVYIPPERSNTPTQLDSLFKFSNDIIVGDMNARNQLWRADSDDTRGQLLEHKIAAHNYVILNTGQGTRQSLTGSVSHIDVSLASRQLAVNCQWTTLNDTMGSDHVPIIITVNATPDRNSQPFLDGSVLRQTGTSSDG